MMQSLEHLKDVLINLSLTALNKVTVQLNKMESTPLVISTRSKVDSIKKKLCDL